MSDPNPQNPLQSAAGLHLDPAVRADAPPGISAVAVVDGAGRVVQLTTARADEEILAALPAEPALVAVDAPLSVENATGRRGAEELLAWCDIVCFPVARRRMEAVHGGLRGEGLRHELARRGHHPVEVAPDLVLRQIAWEADNRTGVTLGLADYRERWLGVTAPRHRPSRGRAARGAEVARAFGLATSVLDTGGWAPQPGGGNDAAARDAACIDALAAAYAAWRHLRGTGSRLLVDAAGTRMILPVDGNLDSRLRLHVQRLADEGIATVTLLGQEA